MLAEPVDRVGAMAANNLFSRQEGNCVHCATTDNPQCPTSCPAGTSCKIIIWSCQACPRSFCEKDLVDTTPAPSTQNNAPPASSTNTGAIAGGVAGGLVVVALITYLVWKYCIKTKRGDASTIGGWDSQSQQIHRESQGGDPEMSFAARRDQRSSTHTVNSIASTVLTRASNIIQIAYIPGVTNRAAPSSPNVLVPPVPPIPIGLSGQNSPAATEDQHFFVPGDLRDSTYSGVSGYTDRTSYARTSYAPRSSIASTIYGKSAVVISPAQTGMRAKPAMVSVKSYGGGSGSDSGANTPPVPSVDFEKYGTNGSGVLRPPSPANSTFSVGSTFLNNASAHTAMPARAMMVRVGSGPKKVDMPSGPMSEKEGESVSQSPGKMTKQGHASEAYTLIDDSPASDQGPFSDPPLSPSARGAKTGLSAVIEEATRMASQRDSVLPPPSQGRVRSPFSDTNRSSP